jgi:hypothetical protein
MPRDLPARRGAQVSSAEYAAHLAALLRAAGVAPTEQAIRAALAAPKVLDAHAIATQGYRDACRRWGSREDAYPYSLEGVSRDQNAPTVRP